MKPFDTFFEAIEWLNTTKGVGAGSQCVLIRHYAVTFIYVDHQTGWHALTTHAEAARFAA